MKLIEVFDQLKINNGDENVGNDRLGNYARMY